MSFLNRALSPCLCVYVDCRAAVQCGDVINAAFILLGIGLFDAYAVGDCPLYHVAIHTLPFAERIFQIPVEVANHAFSVYILDVDDKNFDSQIKVLEDAYCSIDALALPPQRIYIIDSDGSTRIAQYALDKGYRLNRKMSYGPDYQLDF